MSPTFLNNIPGTCHDHPFGLRFKSPRPVMALKFCSALVGLINAAPKPGALKTAVETIGFQHLDVDTWLNLGLL